MGSEQGTGWGTATIERTEEAGLGGRFLVLVPLGALLVAGALFGVPIAGAEQTAAVILASLLGPVLFCALATLATVDRDIGAHRRILGGRWVATVVAPILAG